MAIKNTHNTIKISSVDHEKQSPIIIKNDSVDRATSPSIVSLLFICNTLSFDDFHITESVRLSSRRNSAQQARQQETLLILF